MSALFLRSYTDTIYIVFNVCCEKNMDICISEVKGEDCCKYKVSTKNLLS